MADDDLRICPNIDCGEIFLEGQRTLQPVQCPKCGTVLDDSGDEINE